MTCSKFSHLAVFLIAAMGCFGQKTFVYPKIIAQGRDVIDFVPTGWQIFDSTINRHSQKDYTEYAYVLQQIDSAFIEIKIDGRVEKINTTPRILIVLFQNKKSRLFRLIDQNNKLILPWNPDSGSDPFASIQFEDSILHISFSFSYGPGAHVEPEYIFRYDGNHFVLIGFNSSYYSFGTREMRETSYNFLTGKYWISQGREDSEDANKEIWHKIKYKGLRPLSAFEEPYTWTLNTDESL